MSDKYIRVMEGLKGIEAFFATKEGAADGYPYDRSDVFAELGLEGATPVWPKQVHGDRIAVIERRPAEPLKIADTDGLITDQKGVLLTTVHADCLPVYFFDPQREAIGLVHAGWRGTEAGIAHKAAAELRRVFGCRTQDIRAYIGPGISRCCFETGKEVYEAFAGKYDFMEETADEKVNEAGELKYYIDLKDINRRQLEAAGLKRENIAISEHCTCCEPELFCSYRREGGTYRRMGAGICMRT